MNLYYSSLYNFICNTKNRNNVRERIDEVFAYLEKNKLNTRETYWITKHLLTIQKTQSVGSYITSEEKTCLKTLNTISELCIKNKLKKIQVKTIEHLWRPNGAIFKKNMNTLYT